MSVSMPEGQDERTEAMIAILVCCEGCSTETTFPYSSTQAPDVISQLLKEEGWEETDGNWLCCYCVAEMEE